jgi:hypothetical protein
LGTADQSNNQIHWGENSMNKIVIAGMAGGCCLALAACNSATVATAPLARDPLRASASYPAATTPTAVPDTRYDGGCRSKFPVESSAYGNCLQGLRASAMVGGGR